MLGEGRIGVIPDSVLAMVQLRIFELPLRLRRVLLAASVFGAEFWSGSAAMLVAGGRDVVDLEVELSELEYAEFIDRQPASRYAGEFEYGLRNPVVREAAYGLLTEEERKTAHRLAASWLKQVGESDAMTLALHYELGGVQDAAVACYVQAADLALERAALEDAIRIAQRGQACGATGPARGELLAVESLANAWLWRVLEALRLMLLALELLPPGSQYTCLLHGFLVCGALLLGRPEEARMYNRRLLAIEPSPAERNSYVRGAALALAVAVTYGARDLSNELLARIKQIKQQTADLDSNIAAAVCHGWSDHIRTFQADPWQVRQLAREAAAGHKAAGDRSFYLSALIRCGQSTVELGELEPGIQMLRDAVVKAEQNHDQFFHSQALLHLAAALAGLPSAAAWQEAEVIARLLLAAPDISPGYQGWAHGLLAQCGLARDDFAQVESEVEIALPLCKSLPLRRLWLKTLLARCRLGQKRASLELAQEILQELERMGGAGYIEITARLTATNVLFSIGALEQAKAELAATMQQIRHRADKIPDLGCRASYLENVAENAAACQLAQRWQLDATAR